MLQGQLISFLTYSWAGLVVNCLEMVQLLSSFPKFGNFAEPRIKMKKKQINRSNKTTVNFIVTYSLVWED
jgi:hypothetical protein